MEFRKIFDTIPEKFDKYRPRYCDEAFAHIIKSAAVDSQKSILEIGPGTGQATEPFLKTGCDYTAIELGEHLYEFTKDKFKAYPNFKIVNGDFETHDFGEKKFDLILSAATIQWIPEKIAFPKCYELLKSGGTLAMMMTYDDYRTPNEALFDDIQKVYSQYFHPEIPYSRKLEYENAVNYGFTDFKKSVFHSTRTFTADEYVEYTGTHSNHLVLKDDCKAPFFEGLRSAVLAHGNKIVFDDSIIVYLTKKP